MHKCVNAAAFYCEHDPKCLYMDKNGDPLPCRNKHKFPKKLCCEACKCHTTLPGYREAYAPEEL